MQLGLVGRGRTRSRVVRRLIRDGPTFAEAWLSAMRRRFDDPLEEKG